MREHDILVLPSIVEGCALVQQEALSCGLPLLITRNTGGEELIDNQKTGFIVPIREPNMIAEKIEWFIDNIEDIHLMKSYCIKKSKDYSWIKYAQNLISFLNNQQEY
jgi:glycosyltransferase involved in cell wall biosynthesis